MAKPARPNFSCNECRRYVKSGAKWNVANNQAETEMFSRMALYLMYVVSPYILADADDRREERVRSNMPGWRDEDREE
jgi:hypothetical protein